MLNAVIIDDIAEARETLKQDLSDYCPDVHVIGEADGVVTGAKEIRSASPDLVFLDIQMNDGTGFDLLEVLGDHSFKVIFTTASDSYAIKAFRFSAVDYLLKPVDPDELVTAVKKVIDSDDQKENLDLLADNMSGRKQLKKLALHTQEKIHIANIDEIVRCESNVNYTMFHFADGGRLLVTKTLKEFDEMLHDSGFIRTHQSHLINANFVKEFVKSDGGYIVMTDGSDVPVSTRKRSEVLDAIGQL